MSESTLRIKELAPGGAWLIRAPRWPWKHKAGQEERKFLISKLVQKYPFTALWSSPENDPQNPYIWTFSPPHELWEAIDRLCAGAWVLFFFSEEPGTPLQEILTIPTDERELKNLLRTMLATAVIASWYDDNEWVLVTLDYNPL